MGSEPLRIIFGKIDEFIKIYNGIIYLVIFCYWQYDKIFVNIKYLISEKSDITDSVNNSFSRIRINSYNYLPIEKLLTFHNVIVLIKSIVNENKNHYYYNIFLEKGWCEDKSNIQYF